MQTRSKAILLATLSFWLVHSAVFTLSNALEDNPHLHELALARIAVSGVGVAFCYAILFALRRLPTRRLAVRIAALAIMAPIAAEAFAWVSYFALQMARGQPISFNVNWNSALIVLSMYTWLFFAWASLVFSIEYSFDLREEERRNAEYRELAQDAKLRALQAQINPHFLFNSLNSLSALILDRRNEDADLMVTRLANFFRLTLSANSHDDIALSDEIRLQSEYLAIERVRYPGLDVDVDVPASLLAAKVPALLLQPLIENAVKHGAIDPNGSAGIVIRASRGDSVVVVEVENSLKTQARKLNGTGRGLSYVRDRLASRYGTTHTFIAGPVGDRYRVSIKIPFVT